MTQHLDTAKYIAVEGISFGIISASHLFPPLDVLNDFFLSGIDDSETEQPIQWSAFALTRSDYLIFHRWCCTQWGELKINNVSCKSHKYGDWFLSAINRKN